MRIKNYDVDGFGSPFAIVHLKQSDIDKIYWGLKLYEANKYIDKQKEVPSDLQSLIDEVLEIDDEFFKMRNERDQ